MEVTGPTLATEEGKPSGSEFQGLFCTLLTVLWVGKAIGILADGQSSLCQCGLNEGDRPLHDHKLYQGTWEEGHPRDKPLQLQMVDQAMEKAWPFCWLSLE